MGAATSESGVFETCRPGIGCPFPAEVPKSSVEPQNVASDRCCRRSNGAKNLANGDFWTTPPLRCSVVPIRSVVVFLRRDVVPHVAAHETHQQFWKILLVTPKRLFRQHRPEADRSAAATLATCWFRPQSSAQSVWPGRHSKRFSSVAHCKLLAATGQQDKLGRERWPMSLGA